MKNAILIAIGFVFLALGAVGVFLPILPTTPFVLLSSACFSTSPALRAKIMKIRFFREHIENYQERKGLSRKTLAISLVYLWGMLSFSAFMIAKPLWYVILSSIGIAVTIHLAVMARAKD